MESKWMATTLEERVRRKKRNGVESQNLFQNKIFRQRGKKSKMESPTAGWEPGVPGIRRQGRNKPARRERSGCRRRENL